MVAVRQPQTITLQRPPIIYVSDPKKTCPFLVVHKKVELDFKGFPVTSTCLQSKRLSTVFDGNSQMV